MKGSCNDYEYRQKKHKWYYIITFKIFEGSEADQTFQDTHWLIY